MGRENGTSRPVRAAVRHGALRRSNPWTNAVKILLTGVLAVAMSGVAVAAYAVWGLAQEVKTVDLVPSEPDPEAVGAGQQRIDGAFTILLVGSDSRQGQELDDGAEGELNDVNLLLHVSADHQNATVVSFPRDLMLAIPSCPGPNGEEGYYSAMSEQQLNSAMSYGGLPCVVRTIENLTGMEIPYAGVVTFDGVIGVSNAIGGVTVCLNEPIYDPMTDFSLDAGEQTIQGVAALQFLRTRYGVGDGGDKSRISNQQMFMSALVRQLQSAETLSNPVKVFGLAKAGVENMTLSSNMATVQFLQALAGTVKDIDLERTTFVQYPTFSHPYQEGRLTPDYTSGELLISVILSGQPFEIVGTGEGIIDTTPEAPVETTEPPVEGGEAPVEGETPVEGEAPVETPPVTVLPENITGQTAAQETCSAGRTML